MSHIWSYSYGGYELGLLAPGRCSKWIDGACRTGNSATEPYIVSHHLLLSHALAVKLYKQKYQAIQKGKIGITLIAVWMVPYSQSQPNVEAAKRALDFMFGWFMEPLSYVDAPITNSSNISCSTDSLAILTPKREGIPIGPRVCIYMRENHFQCVKITKAIHKLTSLIRF
ncbi:hypothetical protein EZV62_014742 [Acer yangbiense]|uniref:Uncharacterized protein n=1 Tax=Acer yangbiense TaxID=1000413 RepID=A0A5C7HTW6_9ROSI|nr:hypothetical protein EZV62_014742 [Acer yangbiense]